ncbi:MAG: hypothetical protein H6601_11365 [Flavobacteriales bacterium]|nr:hypothetical protein [Flavobacteriales bacterium]
MEKVTLKKIFISYLITSLVIFLVSAAISIAGTTGKGMHTNIGEISIEIMMMIQLAHILVANAILHWFFYFGGSHASPLTKGVATAAILGVMNFMISVFALNIYDIYTDSLSVLLSGMSSRVVEYGSGGILAAIISVTDIHKWAFFRLA